MLLLNPQRNNTNVSVDLFNKAIQSKLNPPVAGAPEIRIGGKAFRVGDKVMQMKNTDIAQNGDCGYIRNITAEPDPDDPESKICYAEIEFNDSGVMNRYAPEDIRNIELAYGITTHKSQGAEAKNVILVVATAHPTMLRRKILYTGATRAKERVFIVGQGEALKTAIACDASDVRYTLLAQRLRVAVKKET